MAFLRFMLFYTTVSVVIQTAACFQQENVDETNVNIYDGMTDREIILKLLKQNDYLVKTVRSLENWNVRQQQDIGNLQATVRKQQRKLQSFDRILVNINQDGRHGHVQGMSETTAKASSGNNITSGSEDVRKGDNRVTPSIRIQPPRTRIVEKGGKDVRNGFEGLMRNTRQSETFNRVAFFATVNAHISNLGAGQVVEFRNVVTNIGNAYSGSTGVFTAPVSGTYVFSASLMGLSGTNHYYSITKNHQAVSGISISDHNPYATSSQTFILELKNGDDVEIRSDDAGRAIYGDNYSCFSGFLLYEDESSGVIVG